MFITTPIVHVFGGSGAGTTTLAAALAQEFSYTHLDADDFFWQPTNPPYTDKRSKSERQRLLRESLDKADRAVISGCLCSWGEIFLPYMELGIWVETPLDICMERLKVRERLNFGPRIDSGGDMHQNHVDFLAYAQKYDEGGLDMRSRKLHEKWRKMLPCPCLKVDGALPVESHFTAVRKQLLKALDRDGLFW